VWLSDEEREYSLFIAPGGCHVDARIKGENARKKIMNYLYHNL